VDYKKNEAERIRAEKKGFDEIDLQKYSGIIAGGSPFDLLTPQNQKSDIIFWYML